MGKNTVNSGSSSNLTPAQTPRTWTAEQIAARNTGVYLSGGNQLQSSQPPGTPAVGDNIN